MLLVLPGMAYSEETSPLLTQDDVASLQRAADEMGAEVDVYSEILNIVTGKTVLDGEYFRQLLISMHTSLKSRTTVTMGIFIIPLIISALFARLFPRNKRACELICGCAGTALFIPIAIESMNNARRITEGIASLLEASVPLLTTLTALGGGTASAALITPAAALTGEVMAGIIGSWGLFLTGMAAMCACADSLGSAVRLNGLFSLIKRVIQTCAGFMLALFAGILKVQGMLGASFDSAAVKSARFAVDKLVPAIGGGIADTMDAAISSVMLMRSAVGITGILIMVSACAQPVANISATLLGLRLANAIAQPVADSPLLHGVEEFGDVMRLLLVLCAASITLAVILTGAAIGAGGSISGMQR